jgi:two-component system chemotaxis response regulator CheY
VLTVDDSAATRAMLGAMLDAAGFDVVQAEDGACALQLLADGRPDLLITDINMPRLDGIGLIQAVRKLERLRQMPILVLTSETNAMKRAQGRRLGVGEWLLKPFDGLALCHAVARLAL